MHGGHHATIQFVSGLVHTWSINQHNLTVGAIDDTDNLEARRLRFVRNRGDLFTDQTVQKRRFARVGPANESDISGAKRFSGRLL